MPNSGKYRKSFIEQLMDPNSSPLSTTSSSRSRSSSHGSYSNNEKKDKQLEKKINQVIGNIGKITFETKKVKEEKKVEPKPAGVRSSRRIQGQAVEYNATDDPEKVLHTKPTEKPEKPEESTYKQESENMGKKGKEERKKKTENRQRTARAAVLDKKRKQGGTRKNRK